MSITSYRRFLCRFSLSSCGYLYFGEIPKGTIVKFGIKNIEILGYFPLAANFGAQAPVGFRRWTSLHQISGRDKLIICENKFMLRFQKIAPFWNGHCPVETVIDKNCSKWL